MEDFLNKARSGFNKTMETISKKSGELMEISKCKSAISVAADNLEKNYGEIGRYINDMYENGDCSDDFINEKCERIAELKAELIELRKKLSEIRNLKTCPQCQHECEYEDSYCSKCGYEFSVTDEEE